MSTNNAAREQYFYTFLDLFHEDFFEGETKPLYRLSCGIAPHTQGKSKTLGVCFEARASSDLHNEMFFNPTESDSARMLSTAIHEYCHSSRSHARDGATQAEARHAHDQSELRRL